MSWSCFPQNPTYPEICVLFTNFWTVFCCSLVELVGWLVLDYYHCSIRSSNISLAISCAAGGRASRLDVVRSKLNSKTDSP